MESTFLGSFPCPCLAWLIAKIVYFIGDSKIHGFGHSVKLHLVYPLLLSLKLQFDVSKMPLNMWRNAMRNCLPILLPQLLPDLSDDSQLLPAPTINSYPLKDFYLSKFIWALASTKYVPLAPPFFSLVELDENHLQIPYRISTITAPFPVSCFSLLQPLQILFKPYLLFSTSPPSKSNIGWQLVPQFQF